MQSKFSKIKSDLLVIIDSSGGEKILEDFYNRMEKKFLANPLTEFVDVEWLDMEELNIVKARVELFLRNKHNGPIELHDNLLRDYVKIKLEDTGLFSVFIEEKNCLRIKI